MLTKQVDEWTLGGGLSFGKGTIKTDVGGPREYAHATIGWSDFFT